MKRTFFCFALLLICLNSMAQQWYYIPSGNNPETYNGPIWHVVIKDRSNNYWYAMVHNLKDHLLKDKNYYINAFNNSEYGHDGGPQYNILGEYMYTLPVVVHDYYRVYNGQYFEKLILEETRTKCRIYKYKTYPNIQKRMAFSLDFNTLIFDFDKADPSYYNSVPLEKFIVRKSVDDLF